MCHAGKAADRSPVLAQRRGAWSGVWVFGCAPKYCHSSCTGGSSDSNAGRIFGSFRGRKEGGWGLTSLQRMWRRVRGVLL